MSNNKQYSDEHLNAFIDDQLDTAEKTEILDEIRHNAELSQRICKLQKLHNLVQLSYQSIDVPEQHQNTDNKKSITKVKWFAAASFLLALGMVMGWVSHQSMNANNISDIAKITHNPSLTNNADNWKLMLHVSTANPKKLNIVLDEAETMLKQYASSSRNLQLEILANSDGLALVSDNGKNYNKKLQELQQKYDNLAVVVCGQTLKRVQSKQAGKVKLLPDTSVVSSAINQIVKRQQGGWSYIRI